MLYLKFDPQGILVTDKDMPSEQTINTAIILQKNLKGYRARNQTSQTLGSNISSHVYTAKVNLDQPTMGWFMLIVKKDGPSPNATTGKGFTLSCYALKKNFQFGSLELTAEEYIEVTIADDFREKITFDFEGRKMGYIYPPEVELPPEPWEVNTYDKHKLIRIQANVKGRQARQRFRAKYRRKFNNIGKILKIVIYDTIAGKNAKFLLIFSGNLERPDSEPRYVANCYCLDHGFVFETEEVNTQIFSFVTKDNVPDMVIFSFEIRKMRFFEHDTAPGPVMDNDQSKANVEDLSETESQKFEPDEDPWAKILAITKIQIFIRRVMKKVNTDKQKGFYLHKRRTLIFEEKIYMMSVYIHPREKSGLDYDYITIRAVQQNKITEMFEKCLDIPSGPYDSPEQHAKLILKSAKVIRNKEDKPEIICPENWTRAQEYTEAQSRPAAKIQKSVRRKFFAFGVPLTLNNVNLLLEIYL